MAGLNLLAKRVVYYSKGEYHGKKGGKKETGKEEGTEGGIRSQKQ